MTTPAKEIQLRGDSVLQLPFIPPRSLYGAKLGDLNDVDVSADTDGNVLTVQPDGTFALETPSGGGGGGSAVWGGITGTLSSQTDLQTALSGKAAASHTHATSDVTGLDSALSGKAAASHTHATSDVTGLDSALSGKAAASHTHSTSDVTGLDAALSGKAAASHTHATSDVTGLDSALSGKAAASHSHAIADTTGLQSALDEKAPLASPTFTGTPAVPTATSGTNTTQIASTAFVMAAVGGSGGALIATNNLSDLANAATARTNLGLTIGTHVQAWDAELAAIAGLTSAADKGIVFTGSGTASTFDLTTAGRALLDDANAAAQRSTLGLVIGTNVQAFDNELQAIAGLTSAANKLPFFTGSGTADLADFTLVARYLLDDGSFDAMITTLGGVAFTGTGGLVRRNNPTITGSFTLSDGDLAVNRYANQASCRFRRVNGSPGSETAVLNSNIVGLFGSLAWHSSGAFHTTFGAYFSFVATENCTATAQGTDVRFFTTPNGSTSPVERMRIGESGLVSCYGAVAVTGALSCGNLTVGVYTFATVPSASANTGATIRISDRSHRLATSDGTNWNWAGTTTVIS